MDIFVFYNVMIVMLSAMVEVVGVSNEGIHQKETSAKYYQSMDGLLCRKCSRGQYMKSACEKQYGMSICDRCPNETYMHFANNRSKCNHCTICQMTQIVVQPCTAVQDRRCGCKEGMEWNAADGGQGQCLHIVTTEPHETTSPTPPTTSPPSTITPTPCPNCAESENQSCSGIVIFGYIMIGVLIGVLIGILVYLFKKHC